MRCGGQTKLGLTRPGMRVGSRAADPPRRMDSEADRTDPLSQAANLFQARAKLRVSIGMLYQGTVASPSDWRRERRA
jgi:hypothetical protein